MLTTWLHFIVGPGAATPEPLLFLLPMEMLCLLVLLRLSAFAQKFLAHLAAAIIIKAASPRSSFSLMCYSPILSLISLSPRSRTEPLSNPLCPSLLLEASGSMYRRYTTSAYDARRAASASPTSHSLSATYPVS